MAAFEVWRRVVRVATCLSVGVAPAAAVACDRPTFAPCQEVACKSKDELTTRLFADESHGFRRRPQAVAAASAALAPEPATKEPSSPPLECPPDRDVLGRATWTFLHAVAAYYPDSPTEEERRAAASLIDALRVLYPCLHCRDRLKVDLQRMPPATESRQSLSLWVCQQHNIVNELQGKPLFPCTPEALNERWRSGRPECWGGTGGTTSSESLGQSDDLQ